jgi:hypothetical protein
MDRRTDGRTETIYIPHFFFEKAGDNKADDPMSLMDVVWFFACAGKLVFFMSIDARSSLLFERTGNVFFIND